MPKQLCFKCKLKTYLSVQQIRLINYKLKDYWKKNKMVIELNYDIDEFWYFFHNVILGLSYERPKISFKMSLLIDNLL